MKAKLSEWFVLLQIGLDIGASLFAFFSAFVLKVNGYIGGKEYVPALSNYLPFFGIILLVQLIVFFSLGLYAFKRRSFLREVSLLSYATLIWVGMALAILFLEQQFYFSRLLLVTAFGIFFGLAFIGRILIRLVKRLLYRMGVAVKRVVIVGSGEQSQYLAHEIHHLHGYQLASLLPDEQIEIQNFNEIFAQFQQSNGRDLTIDEVWLATDRVNQAKQEDLFDFCADHKILFRYVPSIFASSAKRLDALYVGDYPLIEVSATPLKGWGRIGKRLMDIVISLLGMIVLSPVFLVIAILIKIWAPGPVFIGLTRVGNKKYQTPFTMYKFRSMIVGAHQMKKDLMAQNERKGGPLFKMKDDPRVTSIGKVLRKFRLDELPQLWNVLKGQMTLVGPRAHEPEEVAKYTTKQLRLLRAKPGMTGMAQVNGASDLSFDEEVRLESYYIQNWSLRLDWQILFRTIWVVINKKGAA
jgi:exopolysaccharide biosynthesis polyprenyl glycosylphosphotransferase